MAIRRVLSVSYLASLPSLRLTVCSVNLVPPVFSTTRWSTLEPITSKTVSRGVLITDILLAVSNMVKSATVVMLQISQPMGVS